MNELNELVPGQLVMVYEDPITCVTPEGKATLIEHIWNPEPYFEYWTVHFVGDGPGYHFDRKINLDTHDPDK